MGFFSNGKGKGTPDASSSRAPPPSSARAHSGRLRLHIPVLQARLHWEFRQSLPCPDVTLPHYWDLDPQRIPMPAVPRAHDEELHRRRAQLTPAQQRMPEYAADSPNWEAWFALEHEEQRRLGVQRHHANPPPPVVKPEEEEAEATYWAALAEAFANSIGAGGAAEGRSGNNGGGSALGPLRIRWLRGAVIAAAANPDDACA